MALAEELDQALIRYLKAVRLEGLAEGEAWRTYVSPVSERCKEVLGSVKPSELSHIVDLLLAIHKAIWDRDTHVRNFSGPFLGDDGKMTLIGLLAIDARDFNHLRVRTVNLLKAILGEDDGEPNLKDGRLTR